MTINYKYIRAALHFCVAVILSLPVIEIVYVLIPNDAVQSAQTSLRRTNELDNFVNDAAISFHIPTPYLNFTSSSSAGYTSEEGDPKGKFVVISLGKPLANSHFDQNPELLKATIGHELGHAVLIARRGPRPKWLIRLTYSAGLLPVICIMPFIRSSVILAALITVGIVALTMSPSIANPHNAFLSMLVLLLIAPAAVQAFLANKLSKIPIFLSIAHYFPKPTHYYIACATGIMLFTTAVYFVGKSNHNRELFSDAVGSCVTTPLAMQNALRALHPENSIDEKLDFYHPALNERIDVLKNLSDELTYAKTCDMLRSGKTSITLVGHTIQ